VEDLDKMVLETEDFWVSLVKSYLVEAPCATIRGKPSLSKLEEMTGEEQRRIEQQKADLGEEGLKEKQRILDESIQLNQVPPPDDLVTTVKIPSPDSITYHQMKRFVKGVNSHPNLPLENVPVYIQVDDVHSNFVYVSNSRFRRAAYCIRSVRFFFLHTLSLWQLCYSLPDFFRISLIM